MTVLSRRVIPPCPGAPDPHSTPFQIIEETYQASQERAESLAFSDGVNAGMAAAGVFMAVGLFLLEAIKYFL